MQPLHHHVAELRALRDLFRRYVSSHQQPTIDACRELTVKLGAMAEDALVLSLQARVGEELEAVAADLDVIAYAKTGALGPPSQTVLREEQRAIQLRLDAGPPVRTHGMGLAALSAPIGDGRVVTFPKAPQPRPVRIDCQGDDGDAA